MHPLRILKFYRAAAWVSNCVGFRNYRTFFLFMAYLWVGCVYIMATSGPTFFRHIHHVSTYISARNSHHVCTLFLHFHREGVLVIPVSGTPSVPPPLQLLREPPIL